MIFESSHCIVQDKNTNKISFICRRIVNIHVTNLDNIHSTSIKCLALLNDESWLWHKRLSHVNLQLISNLSKNDIVLGLPKINFEKDHLCDACQKGKQVKSLLIPLNIVSTSKSLQLRHIDLFGPIVLEERNMVLSLLMISLDLHGYSF